MHQYFRYYHCEGVQLGLQPNRQGTPSKPLSWIDGTNTYPRDHKGLVGGTNTYSPGIINGSHTQCF